MPSLEDLKKRNGPVEALSHPYLPMICAIPKEQWEAMLQLQTGMVRALPELRDSIGRLPTAQSLEQALRDFHQQIYREQANYLGSRIVDMGRRNEDSMEETFRDLKAALIPKVTAAVKGLEVTLRHRDMWAPTLKRKWFGLGCLCTAIFFLLLRLSKIW